MEPPSSTLTRRGSTSHYEGDTLDVHPGEEYAARFVPLDTDQGHTVQAAIAMMRAADADDLRAGAMRWRFPPAHCVYADADGEVGYMPLGAIPVRATGGNCLLGRSAQSGALSSMQWQGYIPFDLKPQVAEPAGGTVFSANHLIVGSWYPIPLHLNMFNTGDGDRSWRLRELLDTAAHPVFTPQEVADIRFDVVNPALREVVRAGVYLRDNDPPTPPNLSPSAIQNVNELESWLNAGALSKLDQPKFAGAYWLDTMFRYDENSPWKDLVAAWGNRNLPHYLKDLKVRLDRWDATGADPMIGDQEILYLSNSLQTGFDKARQFYGPPAAWQAGLTAEIGHQNVLYAGSLEGFEPSLNPAYDVDYAGFIAPHGGTIRSQRAAASVLIMNLGQPDASLACTPTGVSENPASVHFDDQADEWIVGNLRAAPLSRSAITDPVTITLQYPPP